MSRSHVPCPTPSPLLALVCLAVVSRLRPTWTAVSLSDAARGEGVSPERLSRLCSRAVDRFEQALDVLTRIGRPRRDSVLDAAQKELGVLRALLQVATALLNRVPLRGPVVRALVLGAWARLKQQYPELTKKIFCQTLALPERTFRHWQRNVEADHRPHGTSTVVPPRPTRTRRLRPPRRPRFGFDVTVPETQQALDTTALSAFGVPLKLIASQDVGGRDSSLFDAILVDDHESAELVVRVLTEALTGREGMQAITDQGTPYMAERTREALDELEAEHAPQREADPLGKATIERAFRTVKDIARPLLALTEKVADAVPALRNAELAKATATLVVTALLRAYQAGARAARRADEQRAGADPETLARVAEENREQARADERSARLLLAHLHQTYHIARPLQDFIRGFRRYPLPVLREAERAFADQVHRDDIRDRASYFGKIVRRCSEAYRNRRAREREAHAARAARADEERRFAEQREAWLADPVGWLRQALDTIAAQWLPERGELLCGGVGAGTAWLRGALARLVEVHGPVAGVDIAGAAIASFASASRSRLGDDGVRAVVSKATQHAAQLATAPPTVDVAAELTAAILRDTGPPRRPEPPFPLRR